MTSYGLSDAPPCAAPLASVRLPRHPLPANACDSHLHILGPAQNFPYIPERVYTPVDCLLADYQLVRSYLGLARCVLVQPSVYGPDNRVLLGALEDMGDAARGVVVLRGNESPDDLSRMHALGVRGVRVNLVDLKAPRSQLPREQLQHLADMIRPHGWHLELLMHVDQHPDMTAVLAELGVQLVFGHMGYLSRDVADYRHPGMKAMLALAKSKSAWVKVTAPYRLADQPGYQKAADVTRWLASECLDRLVWGSDWPHVMVKTDMPHDADLLDAMAEWLPDRGQQEALFAANAATLYGWPP